MTRSIDQIPRKEKGKMIMEDSEDSWDEGYDSTDSDTSFHHGEIETIKPSYEGQPSEPFIKVHGIVFQKMYDEETCEMSLHAIENHWKLPPSLIPKSIWSFISLDKLPYRLKEG